MRGWIRWVLAAAFALAASCGGSENGDAHSSQSEHPRVTGTVVDGRTGEPVAGATVIGPAGSRARSDERGWFVLEGLSVGTSGEVRATTEDGSSGVTPLRSLTTAGQQIVVRVQ